MAATTAFLAQDGLLGSEFTCDSIDLNGDGATDSITVSPSGLGLDDGWISIAPAQQAVMQHTIASPRGEIAFACRVAAVTDVNSDGWRDLAVASARESAAGGWRFHIRIYSSKTGELLGLLDREMSTSTDPLQFTTELDFDGAFAPAADPNRDQQVDIEDLVHVANSLGVVGEAPESDLDANGEVTSEDLVQAALLVSANSNPDLIVQLGLAMNNVSHYTQVVPGGGTAHHYSSFKCWVRGAMLAVTIAGIFGGALFCGGTVIAPAAAIPCMIAIACAILSFISQLLDFLVHCEQEADGAYVTMADNIVVLFDLLTLVCGFAAGGSFNWASWSRILELLKRLGGP